MQRNTKIITATILALGVVTAAAAYGKQRFGDPSARAARAVDYISDELNLDSTQTQALEVLKDQIVGTAQTMRTELSPLKDEMKALVAAEQFDQGRALELINAKTQAVTAAAPEIVTSLGNFLDGLDADQKAEVVEFMDKHGRHHHKHKRHSH